MRKIIYILSLICNLQFAICNLFAQQPNLEWVRRYPDTVNRSAGPEAMTLDDSGNVYVAGYLIIHIPPYNNYGYYCTIKYNPSGTQQWVSTFSGGTAVAIAVDREYNVYVTGSTVPSNTGRDYTTVKYKSNGVQQWVRYYNGPGNYSDYPTAIAVDAAGNIYVTGFSSPGGNSWNYATIKYSPEGRELWVRRYGNGASTTVATAIAIDRDCNVYVTGQNNLSYAVTVKYDSAGTFQWAQNYNGYNIGNAIANSIALDSNNNVCIVGTTSGPPPTQSSCFAVKYSNNGTQLWARNYHGSDSTNTNTVGNSISVDRAGNVYVSGSYNGFYYHVFVTIKYSITGDSLWLRRYAYGNSSNQVSMDMDSSSNIYIMGTSYTNYVFYYVTVKYDSTGVLKWETAYPAGDYPAAIKVDNNRNIYLTGFASGSNMMTMKYSQPVAIIGNTNEIPKQFKLLQNYPNPFNQFTIINYQLPIASSLTITVYDILGREVAVLVKEKQHAGEYSIRFNAGELSSGIYFYSLEANEITITKTMVLIK